MISPESMSGEKVVEYGPYRIPLVYSRTGKLSSQGWESVIKTAEAGGVNHTPA